MEEAMTIEELVELAKTYEEAIVSNELTKNELVVFLALLTRRLEAILFVQPKQFKIPVIPLGNKNTAIPEALPQKDKQVFVAEDAASLDQEKPTKLKVKGIQYDPLYDPEPPFEPTPLPPSPTEIPGRVIAQESTACICNGCRKIGYITNTPIIDGMKIDTFLTAFTPTPGMPHLTRKLEIQNMDGNISIDCPSCGAVKALYLVGKKV